jgi:FkbM family methyltransferase
VTKIIIKHDFSYKIINKKLNYLYNKWMELIYLKEIGIDIKGIIQVGANVGQEINEFKKYTNNILCFEPIQEVFNTLKENNPDVLAYNIGLGNTNESSVIFLASNNFESSSLLKPKNHTYFYPNITFDNQINVRIFRFDSLGIDYENKYNILKSDTQGYEIQVLQGFGDSLLHFDAICVEYINSEQYEGDSSLENLQKYLNNYGFKIGKVISELNGSGDVVFIKKKKLRIVCDGGLSNRINSLLGGLILSDYFNCVPYVHWSPNNWCGCQINDLFDPYFFHDTQSLSSIYENYSEYLFYMHTNQLDKLVHFEPVSDEILDSSFLDKDIVYYNSTIPNFIPKNDLLNKLSSITIKKEILEFVEDFCKHNSIGENSDGVHLRMTDFPENINIQKIYDWVEFSGRKTFVCSDDLDTELKFFDLSNVVINPKQEYPKKLNQTEDWHSLTKDTEGRYFNFNVNRSSNSIVEALKDLLILSNNGNILKTSNTSTFLQLSLLYKEIKKNIFICQN